MTRLFVIAAMLAAFFVSGPALRASASSETSWCYGACEGHNPNVNSAGYVVTGEPQNDDTHCREAGQTTRMIVACLLARRPDCRNWTSDMPRNVLIACWAPEVNTYPWSQSAMTGTISCESHGQERDWTHGSYVGLFQDDHGTGNALDDFEHAYYVKWAGQGPEAWSQTFGRWC